MRCLHVPVTQATCHSGLFKFTMQSQMKSHISFDKAVKFENN